MEINPVGQTNITPQSAPVQDPQPAKEPEKKPQPQVLDTVQISYSAKAMMQEANETAAQTSQEAARGDRQAQRLLDRRAAALK